MGKHKFNCLFKNNEAYNVIASYPHKVGWKSLVESKRSSILESLHNAVAYSRIMDLSAHHSCLNHIKWRSEASSCKSSQKSTSHVKRNTILHWSVLKHHLFVLIICCYFCCIDDWVSHDIRNNSYPEPRYTISRNCFLIAIKGSFIFILRKVIILWLQSNFDNISWICHRNSDCPWQ
mgnify:FL=1